MIYDISLSLVRRKSLQNVTQIRLTLPEKFILIRVKSAGSEFHSHRWLLRQSAVDVVDCSRLLRQTSSALIGTRKLACGQSSECVESICRSFCSSQACYGELYSLSLPKCAAERQWGHRLRPLSSRLWHFLHCVQSKVVQILSATARLKSHLCEWNSLPALLMNESVGHKCRWTKWIDRISESKNLLNPLVCMHCHWPSNVVSSTLLCFSYLLHWALIALILHF